MLLKFAINTAIKLAIKYATKFGVKTDWALVKANVEKWLRDVLPDLIEDELIFVAHKAVEVIRVIISSKNNLGELVELAKDKDLKGAISFIKQQIIAVYLPQRELAMSEDESLLLALQSAQV